MTRKINWEVRLKNKQFWLAIIPAIDPHVGILSGSSSG